MAEMRRPYLITGTDGEGERAVRRLRDRIGDDATELLSALEAVGRRSWSPATHSGSRQRRRLVVVEAASESEGGRGRDGRRLPESPPSRKRFNRPGRGGDHEGLGAGLKAVAKAGRACIRLRLRGGEPANDLQGWVGGSSRRAESSRSSGLCLLVDLEETISTSLAARSRESSRLGERQPIGEREVRDARRPRGEDPDLRDDRAGGRRDVAGVIEGEASGLMAETVGPRRESAARVVGLMPAT